MSKQEPDPSVSIRWILAATILMAVDDPVSVRVIAFELGKSILSDYEFCSEIAKVVPVAS